MQKIPFGATGLHVAPLGFGSAPLGFLSARQERAVALLEALHEGGINLIDTAAMYGPAEELLGHALAGRREEFVLVSKCGLPWEEGGPQEAWSAELIEATVERSLRRLRTDFLDVMLLHSCERSVLERGVAMEALLKVQAAGKVRFVGYSGDNEAAAYAARLPGVAVVEVSVSFCDQANLEKVLPMAKARELGVLAKRPLANAAWLPASDRPEPLRDYGADYRFRFEKMGLKPQELGFPEGDDAWAEIALRFVLSQPGVHTAIVGTIDETNLRHNMAAAEKGPLPFEAVEKIRQAFAAAEARFGEAWCGLT